MYERNAILLSGAATANEGKIHLGYVYGGDRSLATARMMLAGSMPFASLMRRFLDTDLPFEIAKPYLYAVHRTSLYSVDDMAAYYAAVHELVVAANNENNYFGIDLGTPPRRLSRAELNDVFDATHIAAGFAMGEIAIDSVALAAMIRTRIAQDPRIALRTGCNVTAVDGAGDHLTVQGTGPDDDVSGDKFDAVVNALWDGRLAIDATRGIYPGRKWMHRYKHGVRFQAAGAETWPSVTVSLGPYGDFVNYGNGNYHLSWYPACMTARSDALAPPVWPARPNGLLREQILTGAFAAMSAIIPKLGDIRPTEVEVKGGVIFAWGDTDIDDRRSELHSRYEIGVQSYGRYHSINPGKLTMTPYFAQTCADHVFPHS